MVAVKLTWKEKSSTLNQLIKVMRLKVMQLKTISEMVFSRGKSTGHRSKTNNFRSIF